MNSPCDLAESGLRRSSLAKGPPAQDDTTGSSLDVNNEGKRHASFSLDSDTQQAGHPGDDSQRGENTGDAAADHGKLGRKETRHQA
jgi:hypothetical protein